MSLSPNNRILLNIIATYGRALFALLCGLLTGRWALLTLGRVDLGLIGLIGGLTYFISFANQLLSSALSRFYAIAIGKSKTDRDEGLTECRQFFNTALFIHTVVPIVLMMIGYPIGIYAVRHWLTIPLDRIEACEWIFRFSCISCFVGMVSVPFNAMYYAKQYIAEMTIYHMLSTIFHVCILYYMLSHPGDWLVRYSLANCVFGLLPASIILFRAICLFPECRFEYEYLFDWERIKKILNFAGWRFFGALGIMSKNQGIAIVINKCFGPSVNASNSIANNLASQTQTLSSSMSSAFFPAIVNAYGAKDIERMKKLAEITSKIGTLLVLIFALPLMVEVNEVLILWLKNPPEYVDVLCICVVIFEILDRMSYGQYMAVYAVGKIAMYQLIVGVCLLFTIPLALLGVYYGLGVSSIGIAIIVDTIVFTIIRSWLASSLTGLSFRKWFLKLVCPIILTCIGVLSIGWGITQTLQPSFSRVVLTSACMNIALFLISWFLLLDFNEKDWVKKKIEDKFHIRLNKE